jgi:hypothetical protein
MLAALAALLATLPVALAGAFAEALAAGLAGALATTLAAGLTGARLRFHLVPLQPRAQGDPGCGVGGEDVLIYSWSKNLMWIDCIQGLFLRFAQRRRER